ncbi:MAG: C25 family cysteine peptidase, partial [Chloroflexi bacterium]|nr:C25 family cysteine peptidase [Chloroflexota bacterium]
MYYRDVRLVRLSLFPLRYNPVAEEIVHVRQLHVELTFTGGELAVSRPAHSHDDQHGQALAQLALNSEQAKSWRSLPADLRQPATELPIGVDVYKVEVNQDGIYEITYADLQAAGMDVANANPQTFEMLYRGDPVAYQFVGDSDTQFEPGEKVRFYGWAFNGSRLEKQFFINNVYWLWAGGTPTLVSSINSQSGFPLATSFRSSVTREPELWWFPSWTDQWASFPNEPDAWYWDRLSKSTVASITRTYPITLPNPALSGPDAAFTAEFSSKWSPFNGGVPQPHVVRVYMNNHPNYGSHSWYDKQNVNITSTAPANSVVDGVNQFQVVLATNAVVGAGNNGVYPNRITVEYQRQFIAVNDQLLFSDEVGGQRQFNVQGYSQGAAANVLIWNVTDPQAPVVVNGATVSGSGPYTYIFGSNHPSGETFIATSTGNVLAPLAISQYVPPSLEPPGGQAEWLAISYHDFITETNRLASHRSLPQYGGLQTHVVDIEDVVNQYGYGLPIPAAIHDYLLHALATWQVAPSYVLLAGDATVNPRDNIGWFAPQYLVTDLVFVDPYQGQIPSDHIFSLLSGSDLVPDVAVGRLPLSTPAEATAIVDKIILYEQNHLVPQSWMYNLLFVSDDPDPQAGDFCLENQLVAAHSPDVFNQIPLCLPPSPTIGDVDALRAQMFGYLNNTGTTLLNYRGHGSLNAWAGSPKVILSTADVPLWTNSARPVMIVTGDCLDGYFVYPTIVSLSETFLKAADKGTMAHWSSTGLGISPDHSLIVEGFYDGLFSAGMTAVGDATSYAKLAYSLSPGHPSLLHSFLLQADPAMQLMRPDLELQKSALQTQAEPGDQVDFVLEVTNNGLYPGRTVITDTLPAGLSFVSATASVTTTINNVGNDVMVELLFGDDPVNQGMPWGGSATITITAGVGTVGAGLITNEALAGSPGLEIVPGDESDTASIQILNVSPVATGDSYATDEEVTLTVSAPGVLGNDNDGNGDPLTAVLQTTTNNGDLALSANGSFVYTPDDNFNGDDHFTYQASDGQGGFSDPVTVTITVGETNDPPTAADDLYGTAGAPLIVSAPGVLANDNDPDGDPLTAAILSDPTHGTLALNADGSFIYMPDASYGGLDTFTYTAEDGNGGVATATVYLLVEQRIFLPILVRAP